MKHWLRTYWPILLIVLLELVIVVTNYVPGTYLMGWDNVMPEFDFKTNIMRNLVGVWQEYRGLGLYDGMSHAAATLHTAVLWMMSAILPQSMLRYAFLFLMHATGGIGMYALVAKLNKKHTAVAFVAALFYLLNPITIQMFYTPLESFAIHFASIPWITLAVIQFLHEPTKRSYLLLCLVFLFSTAQFFIPTLFIPITLLVVLICLFSLRHWKRVFLILVAFISLNAFWLVPFLYGAKQTVAVVPQAKINQMSSSEAFLRNQAFGDTTNVLFMKGFLLDFEDSALAPNSILMMELWKTHWNTAISIIGSIVIIGVFIIGCYCLLKKRTNKTLLVPILILWMVCFILLANNTWGIRELTGAIRTHLPVLAELFRSPFTKLATLFSFTYGIIFMLGITWIIETYKQNKRVRIPLLAAILCVISYSAYPILSGNFFYPNLRVVLPAEYRQMVSYMQTKPYGRVALLPQPDYWSWKEYRFGYRGSGFLWYGIPQPTLDRAFDPWSATSEAYYWELSHALYAKDAPAFARVLTKYAVSYLIMDENQMSVSHSRALFIDETKQLFGQIPAIQKLVTFGHLTVYSFSGSEQQIAGITNVPSIQTNSKFVDSDTIYEQQGIYASPFTGQVDSFYPFQSLFTKRSIAERPFIIEDTQSQLNLFDQYQQISFPISKQDAFQAEATPSSGLLPESVTVCNERSNTKPKAEIVEGAGQTALRIQSQNNRLCTTIPFDTLWHKEGYLVQVVSRHISGQPMTIAFINKTARHTELETLLPDASSWQTTYFVLPPLTADGKGYDLYLANDHIAGEKTVNDIASIRFYTIPYEEIIKTTIAYQTLPPQETIRPLTISHPNPAWYTVALPKTASEITLVLNQSYNTGWVAFLSGKPLKNHVVVNNWANGWQIENPTNTPITIIIFFIPQLLEWIGFLLIPIPFLLMIRRKTI